MGTHRSTNKPLSLHSNYIAKTVKKLVEYGDYTEVFEITGRKIHLTLHVLTTKEAERLLANQGLETKIEKRVKFFHDWFMTTATK